MQTAILSQLSCSLVPHSTLPFWHQWEGRQKNENKSNSARRRLFREEPGEEENNQEFVQRLLAELAERYKQKWNFDFDEGRPMDGENGQFQYEAVAANKVPGFYRISTIFGQTPRKNGHPERDENRWSPADENEKEEEMKMMGAEGGMREGKMGDLEGQSGMEQMKSPSRILAKPKRRTTNQTPKRKIEWARGNEGGGGQSKLTDFLNVRKGLARNGTEKEGEMGAGRISVDSPKRRRHSLCVPIPMQNASPIKKSSVDFHRTQRRSQRLFQARQMLFK